MTITRLTQQYVGGLCAGLGLGLMVSAYVPMGLSPAFIIGSLLILIGSSLAYAAQQRARDSDL